MEVAFGSKGEGEYSFHDCQPSLSQEAIKHRIEVRVECVKSYSPRYMSLGKDHQLGSRRSKGPMKEEIQEERKREIVTQPCFSFYLFLSLSIPSPGFAH